MRDRIPTKVLDNGALRYGIYDESGALLRYEYIKPEDEPTDAGTKLDKVNILTDDLEAIIWGNAADRTIKDGFDKMSELYQHWWSVLHGEAYSYYEDVKTPIDGQTRINVYSKTSYSKEISFDATGNITLVNPVEMSNPQYSRDLEEWMQELTSAAPCYITTTKLSGVETLFFIPSGATYSTDDARNTSPHTIVAEFDDDNVIVIYLNAMNVPEKLVAATVTSERVDVPAGATTYEHSADRNAYPDSGTVDGLAYKYLGVPFENARTAKGFKKIGEGKIAVNGSSCYLELEQNLNNYAIVIIDGNNLRGDRDTGTAAIITVLSVASLTATSGSTMGKLLTAYSSRSAWNNFSVAISGITNRACVYLWEDEVGSGSFIASKYLYFSSDYKLLDEATFTVWGFEK